MNSRESFREALRATQPLLGAWKLMAESVAAEMTGRAGFDYVAIDTQHGMIGYHGMLSMLQAISISKVPAIVRVSENSAAEIGRALDAGAQGVIVPYVETAEEAERAVAACRYAPSGIRSWGAIRPSMEFPGYLPGLGDELAACLLMVESVRGVENINDITAVPGVDGIYVGPADLAISAGLQPTLTLEDPTHRRLVERIIKACQPHQLAVGTHVPTVEAVPTYIEMGFRMLTIHVDLPTLRAGLGRTVETARSIVKDALGSHVPPAGMSQAHPERHSSAQNKVGY
jgi:4-hydroxy-2-oxoheptanedioate aldolase